MDRLFYSLLLIAFLFLIVIANRSKYRAVAEAGDWEYFMNDIVMKS